MEVKLRILFFLYKSKTNKKGEAPIYCRITINKKRRQFSTGFFILSKEWDGTRQSVKSNNSLSSEMNNKLTMLKQRILKAAIQLDVQENELSVDSVINIILGKDTKVKGFLEVFQHHNSRVKSLIGKSYTEATYKKFDGIYKQVKDFISKNLKLNDVSLKSIKLKFLLDFEYYLRVDRNLD